MMLVSSEGLDVMPDFMVSHWLTESGSDSRPAVVMSLIPPIREAFSLVGKDLPPVKPTVFPVSRFMAKDGDAWMEYAFFPLGRTDFEVIRESARVVGSVQSTEGEESEQTGARNG